MPVHLACGLFSEVLVLPGGCRFDGAGWQLQPSLGSPLPQALPQARGRNRLGTGLQPISKHCHITGKALRGTQAFAVMPSKGAFPAPLERADTVGVQALAARSCNWDCKMNL